MSFIKVLGAVICAALIVSCTTTENKRWQTIGGSKADGTIILGIDLPAKFGVSEPSATWDIDQANSEADHKCKNWGYAGSEMFGTDFPVQVVCMQIPGGISPCGQKSYRLMYQCLSKQE
jgi:hypothetical protein